MIFERFDDHSLVDLARHLLKRRLNRLQLLHSFLQAHFVSAAPTPELLHSCVAALLAPAEIRPIGRPAVRKINRLQLLDNVDESLADGRLVDEKGTVGQGMEPVLVP